MINEKLNSGYSNRHIWSFPKSCNHHNHPWKNGMFHEITHPAVELPPYHCIFPPFKSKARIEQGARPEMVPVALRGVSATGMLGLNGGSLGFKATLWGYHRDITQQSMAYQWIPWFWLKHDQAWRTGTSPKWSPIDGFSSKPYVWWLGLLMYPPVPKAIRRIILQTAGICWPSGKPTSLAGGFPHQNLQNLQMWFCMTKPLVKTRHFVRWFSQV